MRFSLLCLLGVTTIVCLGVVALNYSGSPIVWRLVTYFVQATLLVAIAAAVGCSGRRKRFAIAFLLATFAYTWLVAIDEAIPFTFAEDLENLMSESRVLINSPFNYFEEVANALIILAIGWTTGVMALVFYGKRTP